MKSRTSCCFWVSSIAPPNQAFELLPGKGFLLRVGLSRSPHLTTREVRRMTKAVHQVIVHHANSLHERVTNRRTDKFEAPFLQISAHGFRFWRLCRYLFHRLPVIQNRHVTHKLPDEVAESLKLFLNSQERLSICHGGLDLQAVANDSSIAHQLLLLANPVPGNLTGIKVVEGDPIICATLQNRQPTQSSLSALQNQKLEQESIVPNRNAPFKIVIISIELIPLSPLAPLAFYVLHRFCLI